MLRWRASTSRPMTGIRNGIIPSGQGSQAEAVIVERFLSDAQWLQRLHEYGLLRASFRPQAEIAGLRAYLRQRERLLDYAGAHIQHMQKALMQMNLQLHHVVSDITGVTGMSIIRTIVAGERDPKVLASHRERGCHAPV